MAGIQTRGSMRAFRYAICCGKAIAYLKACFPCGNLPPAISQYLRHCCMAGYPYQAPMGLRCAIFRSQAPKLRRAGFRSQVPIGLRFADFYTGWGLKFKGECLYVRHSPLKEYFKVLNVSYLAMLTFLLELLSGVRLSGSK